jgi:hypothetical protein
MNVLRKLFFREMNNYLTAPTQLPLSSPSQNYDVLSSAKGSFHCFRRRGEHFGEVPTDLTEMTQVGGTPMQVGY